MEPQEGNWRTQAACMNADPELFFPTGEKSPVDREQIKKAKEYCGRCLAKYACLEYALENNEDFGVWGGTTAGERKSIKRATARTRRRN